MQTTKRLSYAPLYTVIAFFAAIISTAQIFASSTGAPTTNQRPKLVFTCATAVDERGFIYFEKIHKEIFDEMGFDFELQSHNKESTLKLLRTEQADGDCGRHKQFLELSGLDNVLRVEVPFRSVVFSLWQKRTNNPHPHRQDLSVAHQKNLLFLKPALEKMHFKQVIPVSTTEEMMDGLINGRFDAIVHYDTATELQKSELSMHNIENRGQVITLAIHSHLLKKHGHLLEEYTRRLQHKLSTKPFKPPHNPYIPARQSNQILFTCTVPESSKRFQQMLDIYRKAFTNLGYDFKMVSVPRARETAELKRQNISGSCGRAPSFIDKAPHVIALDVKVSYGGLQVWGRNPEDEFDTLAQLPLGASIAYVRGTTAIDTAIEPLASKLTFVEVPNTAVGIKMLDAGRVEFFLGFKVNTAIIIDSMNIRNNLFAAADLPGEPIHPILTQEWTGLALDLTNELNAILKQNSAKLLTDIPTPLQ